MAYRCPEATVVGTAKLDGYELAFRRGYLTILPKEGASVEGLIWSVTDHDESQLDCYEGNTIGNHYGNRITRIYCWRNVFFSLLARKECVSVIGRSFS